MNNRLVSVIIPTYNRSSYLNRAIYSIINQKYKNTEIIVIDDCSDDETFNIISDIKKLKLTKIIYFRFNKKKGAAVARQKGIDLSNGEYIAFLDDDDEWLEKKLMYQINVFENNPQIGAVTCWFYKINDGLHSEVIISNKFIANDLLWGNILGSFSLLIFRRTLINNGLKMNTSLRSCQDWDLWLKIIQRTSVGIVPYYLVKYNRSNINRITNDYFAKVQGLNSILKSYQKHMSLFQHRYHIATIDIFKSQNNNYSLSNRLRYAFQWYIAINSFSNNTSIVPKFYNFIFLVFSLCPQEIRNQLSKLVNISNKILSNSKNNFQGEKLLELSTMFPNGNKFSQKNKILILK